MFIKVVLPNPDSPTTLISLSPMYDLKGDYAPTTIMVK